MNPAALPDAVLFDMDGLLVDTEPLWTVAEHELAARHGAVFTSAAKAAVVGTRLDVAVPLPVLTRPVSEKNWPETLRSPNAWT